MFNRINNTLHVTVDGHEYKIPMIVVGGITGFFACSIYVGLDNLMGRHLSQLIATLMVAFTAGYAMEKWFDWEWLNNIVSNFQSDLEVIINQEEEEKHPHINKKMRGYLIDGELHAITIFYNDGFKVRYVGRTISYDDYDRNYHVPYYGSWIMMDDGKWVLEDYVAENGMFVMRSESGKMCAITAQELRTAFEETHGKGY